jgi:hypothetical protein
MLRNLLIGIILSAAILGSCENPDKASDFSRTDSDDVVVNDDDSSGGDDDDTTVGDDDDSDASPITWTDCSGYQFDKICDFTFTDQNGNDWNLYDHYGTVMILDFSTQWCGVCRNIAGDVQAHMDTFTSQGYDFIWVTILVDGPDWGVPPTEQEINDWVSTYGMTTSPVLRGDRSIVDTTALHGIPVTSWPTFVVVDETLTIAHALRGWNESTLMGWAEEVLLNAQ